MQNILYFQKKSSTLVVLFARMYDENYAEIRASNVTAGSFSLKVKNYQSGTNLKHNKKRFVSSHSQLTLVFKFFEIVRIN